MKFELLITVSLMAVVVVTAVAIVDAKHRARNLFSETQQLEVAEDQLNQDWGKLLLEQGTWAAHNRIERIARQDLQMKVPQIDTIKMVQ